MFRAFGYRYIPGPRVDRHRPRPPGKDNWCIQVDASQAVKQLHGSQILRPLWGYWGFLSPKLSAAPSSAGQPGAPLPSQAQHPRAAQAALRPAVPASPRAGAYTWGASAHGSIKERHAFSMGRSILHVALSHATPPPPPTGRVRHTSTAVMLRWSHAWISSVFRLHRRCFLYCCLAHAAKKTALHSNACQFGQFHTFSTHRFTINPYSLKPHLHI